MLDRLGKFEILECIGKGAMGEVYRGRDPQLLREVAIKTIRPELSDGVDLRQRFAQEARMAGILNHPSVVTIFEFGEAEGLLYLAMEYVQGETLQSLFARRLLSPAEVLDVLAQVCDGLAHAHLHGIVHRDIKPSNIMVLREGRSLRVRILDFGVARVSSTQTTETGHLVGTVAYMAPEYLMTGQSEPASDLFSVGVMLYEGLLGSHPFGGDTTGAVVYKIIHEPLHALGMGLQENLGIAMGRLLQRALAKDPGTRFQHAEELAQVLRAARDSRIRVEDMGTVFLSRAGTRTHGKLRLRRRLDRIQIAALLLASLALVLVVALGLSGGLMARGANPVLAKKPEPLVERTSASNLAVLEGAAIFQQENRPAEALKLIEAVLAEEPHNPRAYAQKLMCLYAGHNLVEFGQVLQKAQDLGLSHADLRGYEPYRLMLELDSRHGKLPEDLRVELLMAP